jgi:DNA polymerase IV
MPLRYLFIDMNAYFASVEQYDNPRLRKQPVAVVPMMAETTCCLAASYEAKATGIRTGTPVWRARQLCPKITFVVGRHERYIDIHKIIVRAVGRCLPVSKICSIDEMGCALMGAERTPERVMAMAHKIKAEIRQSLGDPLTCSIGAAPNMMLAKVAGDVKKPNGFTMFKPEELHERLCQLKVTDFPGIGPRMGKRFDRYGVRTTQQLLALDKSAMSTVWGSKIHGDRWFHLLRGDDVPDIPTRRRTVGHSHILPPVQRTPEGARGVLVRLIHKACARLRSVQHWAGHMAVGVKTLNGERWMAEARLAHCEDTLNWLLVFAKMWEQLPQFDGPILHVWMVLSDLRPASSVTPSLLQVDHDSARLSHAMDAINRKFGKQTVRFGGLVGSEDTAPLRIAFSHIPKINPAIV